MQSTYFKRKQTDIRILKEKKRKKKVNWDKVIYLSILFVSLFLLGSWAFNKYYYVTGDGKVLFETLDVQMADDIQIKKFYCKIGDSVKVGDTLFTFEYQRVYGGHGGGDHINNSINKDNWKEREIIRIDNEIGMKLIESAKTQELLRLINIEKDRMEKEVYLDVYTADRLTPYTKQANEYEQRIILLKDEMKELEKMKYRIMMISDDDSYVKYRLLLKQDSLHHASTLRHAYICEVNGIVSHLFKKDYETVLESEHILSLHIPEQEKIFIKAFFEQDDLRYLRVDDEVEIKFFNGQTSKGIINRFYFDTYELPIHLKNGKEDYHWDMEADILPVDTLDIPLWKMHRKQEVRVVKSRYF